MTADFTRAIKSYKQWFGSYKASGELKQIQVWLTVREGLIEFLTDGNSYKVKRLRRNPRVVCNLGRQDGPVVEGVAEIVTDAEAANRIYQAYWKTHRLMMLVLSSSISRKIKSGTQVVIRVRPDDPNPIAGVTDPLLR
ncbi:MAG TPA: hypothetical protein VJX67_12395 [Blastocatellia bacterium]|nr:hypothetical protein [Blastocatellia bacterium]